MSGRYHRKPTRPPLSKLDQLARDAGYKNFYTAAADIMKVRITVARITMTSSDIDQIRNYLHYLIEQSPRLEYPDM